MGERGESKDRAGPRRPRTPYALCSRMHTHTDTHDSRTHERSHARTFSGLMSRSITLMPWHCATARAISRTSRRASASEYEPSLILRRWRWQRASGGSVRVSTKRAATASSHRPPPDASCAPQQPAQPQAPRRAAPPARGAACMLSPPLAADPPAHALVPELPPQAQLHHQLHAGGILKHVV